MAVEDSFFFFLVRKPGIFGTECEKKGNLCPGTVTPHISFADATNLYKPMIASCFALPQSCPVFAIPPLAFASGFLLIRVSVSSVRVSVRTSAPIHQATETGLYSKF